MFDGIEVIANRKCWVDEKGKVKGKKKFRIGALL